MEEHSKNILAADNDFGNDNEAAERAKAVDKLKKLREEIQNGHVNSVEYRNRDTFIDFKNSEVMTAIINDLTKIRDDMLDKKKLPVDVATQIARREALDTLFEAMPESYAYMGAANSLTENQVKEAFRVHLRKMIDEDLDPEEFTLKSEEPEHELDSKLLTLRMPPDLRNKIFSKLIKIYSALLQGFDEQDFDENDYDKTKFLIIRNHELPLLAHAMISKALILGNKDPKAIIDEYLNMGAQRLVDCVKPEFKTELLQDMQAVVTSAMQE